MLAMAICANGRIRIPLENSLPVNALVVDPRDITVTLRTRLRNVELVHKRRGIAWLFHVVRAVAITAHGGTHIPFRKSNAMNTRLIGCDESSRRSNTVSYIGVVEMTTQTNLGFVGFVHGRHLACDRLDVVFTVAIDAGGRSLDALR